MKTSLLIVLVVSVIVSSSSTVATAEAGTHGRFLFLSQTLPDNSQSIIKRIGELQKQIDELRRQIETLSPGPSKTLVSQIITVTADTLDVSEQFREGTAHCPEGKVVTGGGSKAPINSNAPLWLFNGPGPGQSWTVKAFHGASEPIVFSVFAVCASLE
jgi:TolA-binding protein